MMRSPKTISSIRRIFDPFLCLSRRGYTAIAPRSVSPNASIFDNVGNKSVEEIKAFLPTATGNRTNRAVIEKYVDLVVKNQDTLGTQDLLAIISALESSFKIRMMGHVREKLREVTKSLSRHGPSSFSLSMFMQYAELVRQMRIDWDYDFVDCMTSRIRSIWASVKDPEQLVELASYIIKLNKVVPTASLAEHIPSNFTSDIISKLPVSDIITLLQEDIADEGFKATLDKNFQEVIKSRKLPDILGQLRGSAAIRQAVLSVCATRIIQSLDRSPKVLESFLYHCAKQSPWIPEGMTIELWEELVVEALKSSTSTAVHALSQLSFLPLSTILQEHIHEYILRVANTELNEMSSLTTLLEGLSNLSDHYKPHPEVIGCLLEKVDRQLQLGESLPGLWKLNLWWKITENILPSDSVYGAALRQEFADSIHTLMDHPADEFTQPISPSPSAKKIVQEISKRLTELKVPYVQTPRMRSSPLRSHFLIKLDDGTPVHVIAMNAGRVVSISRGSYLGPNVIAAIAKQCGCEIAFIEHTLLDGQSLDRMNVYEVIRKNLVDVDR